MRTSLVVSFVTQRPAHHERRRATAGVRMEAVAGAGEIAAYLRLGRLLHRPDLLRAEHPPFSCLFFRSCYMSIILAAWWRAGLPLRRGMRVCVSERPQIRNRGLRELVRNAAVRSRILRQRPSFFLSADAPILWPAWTKLRRAKRCMGMPKRSRLVVSWIRSAANQKPLHDPVMAYAGN